MRIKRLARQMFGTLSFQDQTTTWQFEEYIRFTTSAFKMLTFIFLDWVEFGHRIAASVKQVPASWHARQLTVSHGAAAAHSHRTASSKMVLHSSGKRVSGRMKQQKVAP